MFERFTTAARAAVVGAQSHARQAGHAEIGAADLLAGVLDDVDGIPARVLADLGVVAGEGVAATEEVFDADDAAALGALGVDLDAIRRRVEAIPAVKSADVSRAWPHRVHVAVTARVPIAVVNRGDGLRALDAFPMTHHIECVARFVPA